jgi:hypothetical protein
MPSIPWIFCLTFEPLKFVIKEGLVRKSLMLIFGLVGCGAAISGYYLAVSGRRA